MRIVFGNLFIPAIARYGILYTGPSKRFLPRQALLSLLTESLPITAGDVNMVT